MIKDDLDEILEQLEEARQRYEFEISELPEGRLLCSRGNGALRYYQAVRKDGEYDRKGITKDKALVRQLARKEFLTRALPAIESNIKVMERAQRDYVPCDPDAIIGKLGKTYSTLPKEDFFDPVVDVMIMTLDAEDIDRIASHREWGEEPYEAPDFMPEGRTLVTSKGERMRSKAEVLIAEKLYEYGIPFRYEMPLEIDDAVYHPDFTFEGAGGELFYLEFCGLMDDPDYVASFKRKRAVYEAAGICEWKNMIYMFASSNNMNMMEVDSVIRTRVIPLL